MYNRCTCARVSLCLRNSLCMRRTCWRVRNMPELCPVTAAGQLAGELDRLVAEHEDLASVYSLGRTVEGRELLVIQISRGVGQV